MNFWPLQYSRQKMLPQGDLDLLVRTAFLPEHAASECWKQWKQQRDIDGITWEEHKIFARFSTRLATLAADCSYRPRLEGLVKAHWTRSQLMLHASARALDILIENNIPVMLLKGGALQTDVVASHGPRITSDLDVLVPREQFPRAIELLYNAGWRSNHSVEFLKAQWRFNPGQGLRCAPHGDIDIHHQPVHSRHIPQTVLDALWSRAQPQLFYGRKVLVPTPEDLLVFTAAHAAHINAPTQTSAAWVFDLAMLLRMPSLSFEKIANCARDFSATPGLIMALSYLKEITGDELTQKLLLALKEKEQPGTEHWHFFLDMCGRPRNSQWRKLLRYLRRFSGIEYARDVIPHWRQTAFPSNAIENIALLNTYTIAHIRQDISLSAPPSQARHLALELRFDPPKADNYKFEISADGQAVAVFIVAVSKRIQIPHSVVASVLIPLIASSYQCLSIESYCKTILPINPTPAQKHAATPVSFHITRLAWL